jgi:hypothetical protein
VFLRGTFLGIEVRQDLRQGGRHGSFAGSLGKLREHGAGHAERAGAHDGDARLRFERTENFEGALARRRGVQQATCERFRPRDRC